MNASKSLDLDRDAATTAPGRQKFQCPICRTSGIDSNTEVAYTRMNATRDRITRRRRCVRDATHTFSTEESTRASHALELWIRRSTDGKIDSRFSSARLQRDVRRASLGHITDAQLNRVVAEATSSLMERVAEIGDTLSPIERAEHGGTATGAAVWDVIVMEEVERALNDPTTRIPHVLYALGVRGQTNLAHRSSEYAGFADASAFLAWLFADHNYSRLSRALPAARTQRQEMWWSPTNILFPLTVIKRSGGHRPFDFEQFRKSVGRAMRGRSRWVLESKTLAEWVLVQLEGQRSVTSSQLSALVTTALRRSDDIAYLRWAISAKGLTSVAEIADEAEDLVVHPSVRLRFVPDGQPRIDRAAPAGDGSEPDLAARLRALAEEVEAAHS